MSETTAAPPPKEKTKSVCRVSYAGAVYLRCDDVLGFINDLYDDEQNEKCKRMLNSILYRLENFAT